MQPGFFVKILPRKAQVVFKLFSVAVRVFVGQGVAEGIAVVPAPDGGVGGV